MLKVRFQNTFPLVNSFEIRGQREMMFSWRFPYEKNPTNYCQ